MSKIKATHNSIQSLDVLAFGAHPDDVEFGCGGLMVKMSKNNYKTGIIDLTQSELSTNGNVESRKQEAEDARIALGSQIRDNLSIPDNQLYNSKIIQDAVIKKIRKYRPKMVLFPYYQDRHPDHEDASKIVRKALFTTGLIKYKTGQENYRPPYVFMYMMWNEFQPSMIVDISDVWDQKMQAILSYKSQFKFDNNRLKTIDNSDTTIKYIEARARNFGFHIGKPFGEPYLSINPLGIEDPFRLIPNFF